MVDNSAKIANMARMLAITHIIVGFLLFCFGIADLAVPYFWTGYGAFGIWIGAWMCIAGGLGIPGTRKDPSPSRNCLAGVFMGFSITSAVFGGIIIICYGISIAVYRDEYVYSYNDYDGNYGYNLRSRHYNYDAEMAITAIILILGIVEFVIGIWAAVCLCLMNPCACCNSNPPQQGQVMYPTNTGYVMTQGPGGVPVAVPMQSMQPMQQMQQMQPMQAGGGMIAVQTVAPGAQEGQPQMVMVPVSGAMATGYQPQQVEMPPSYGHGQYTTLQNEQV
ncbi:hypothetical protein OS493_032289 [Desmophyllum pertusum]|uniref:Uncharacterized protein n=1 Tax=Desmophyllum pertusum TaxID=174260 RepID=A0A9W9ZA03_9CNID|nr:hypothetical protein OS493_032289 [Desmophyllum pertusum]